MASSLREAVIAARRAFAFDWSCRGYGDEMAIEKLDDAAEGIARRRRGEVGRDVVPESRTHPAIDDASPSGVGGTGGGTEDERGDGSNVRAD